MNYLTIIPTYYCPYKCRFCYYLDKLDNKALISVDYIDSFLKDNHKNIDKVYISGGEPTLIDNDKLIEIINIVKKYNDVEVLTYPTKDTHFISDVEYTISYDFLARPMVKDSWCKLLNMTQDFNMNITLSPIVFKYYPNKILQTLNMLNKLKRVTFIPYYKNGCSAYNIKSSDYKRFITVVQNSNLKLNYAIEFDERFYGKQINDYILTPNNKLNIVKFDDKGIRYEQEIDKINKEITNIPNNILI